LTFVFVGTLISKRSLSKSLITESITLDESYLLWDRSIQKEYRLRGGSQAFLETLIGERSLSKSYESSNNTDNIKTKNQDKGGFVLTYSDFSSSTATQEAEVRVRY
jgi:hypothetical protein